MLDAFVLSLSLLCTRTSSARTQNYWCVASVAARLAQCCTSFLRAHTRACYQATVNSTTCKSMWRYISVLAYVDFVFVFVMLVFIYASLQSADIRFAQGELAQL